MFDAKKFLKEKFISPPHLDAFLSAYGFNDINRQVIDKWFQRGSIPGVWLAILMGLLEARTGRPISILPYIKTEKSE